MNPNTSQATSLTIAIPTYKRFELLKMALESAINQEGNFQYSILIVDDDPEGRIEPEIAKVLKFVGNNVDIRYIRNQENLGIYKNWNKCIDECKTEYLTILNDDDLLHKNFLIEIYPYLTKFDLIAVDADSIGGQRRNYTNLLNLLRPMWHFYLRIVNRIRKIEVVRVSDLLMGHPYVASLGVVFSTKIAREIGGFNPDLYPSSDYEFFLRYWLNGKCIKLRKRLASYRWEVNISLRIETLKGWLIQDRIIKFRFISQNLPERLHSKANFLVNYQSNVSAFRYKLHVSNFEPLEVLNEINIPCYKTAQTIIGQNVSSLMWKILLSDFRLPKNMKRTQ